MTAAELLIALRHADIVIVPQGDTIHVDAPKGVMTLPLAAALKEHKRLLLAVFSTLHDIEREADWECVRNWLLDEKAKTFTPPMQRAARYVFPIGTDEWPEAYARRFRSALRVRGLLLATPEPLPVVENETEMHMATADPQTIKGPLTDVQLQEMTFAPETAEEAYRRAYQDGFLSGADALDDLIRLGGLTPEEGFARCEDFFWDELALWRGTNIDHLVPPPEMSVPEPKGSGRRTRSG